MPSKRSLASKDSKQFAKTNDNGYQFHFNSIKLHPNSTVHQDDQVRRGWSAKTETENYTTICEVNSNFVLGEAIKHETIATIYGVNSNFHFFSS